MLKSFCPLAGQSFDAKKYDVDQLETILLVNRLKQYFFSLEEIADVLHNRQDDSLLFALLLDKKQGICEKQADLDCVMKKLDSDLENMKKGIDCKGTAPTDRQPVGAVLFAANRPR